MEKSFIVEFTGIAGSGKTCICAELYEILKIHGIKCSYINRQHLALKDRFSIKILINSLKIILHIKHTSKKRILINLKSIYENQMRVRYFKKIKKVHLSDQGIFQSIGAIRKYCQDKNCLDLWFNKIDENMFPDLLIVIKTSTDTILKRRNERDGIQYDKVNIEEGQKRMKKLEKEAMAISKINKNFRYIVIINEERDNISDLANQLFDMIKGFI